jgi:hypothetical protein
MGYSVYAMFKDHEEAQKMQSFMEKNFRTIWDVLDYKDKEVMNKYHATPWTDMAYGGHGKDDDKTRMVGFNYNACDLEHMYIWDVSAWMGLKSSVRGLPKGQSKENKKRYPYFVYDGVTRIYLLQDLVVDDEDVITRQKFVPSSDEQWGRICNDLGMHARQVDIDKATKYTFEWMLHPLKKKKEYQKMVDELRRLDDLWKKENA